MTVYSTFITQKGKSHRKYTGSSYHQCIFSVINVLQIKSRKTVHRQMAVIRVHKYTLMFYVVKEETLQAIVIHSRMSVSTDI
jgi:hypothetical protein